jgi:hypothetical protein
LGVRRCIGFRSFFKSKFKPLLFFDILHSLPFIIGCLAVESDNGEIKAIMGVRGVVVYGIEDDTILRTTFFAKPAEQAFVKVDIEQADVPFFIIVDFRDDVDAVDRTDFFALKATDADVLMSPGREKQRYFSTVGRIDIDFLFRELDSDFFRKRCWKVI